MAMKEVPFTIGLLGVEAKTVVPLGWMVYPVLPETFRMGVYVTLSW